MANHPFISETPLRQKLRGQLARLKTVIAESDRFDRVAQAERYAAQISAYIETATDETLNSLRGKFGQNGWAPAIDDICRHLEASHFIAVPHPGLVSAIVHVDDLPVAYPSHLRRAA